MKINKYKLSSTLAVVAVAATGASQYFAKETSATSMTVASSSDFSDIQARSTCAASSDKNVFDSMNAQVQNSESGEELFFGCGTII